MGRSPLIYFLAMNCLFLSAQVKLNYMWPLDSPFVITGNYGELRPNHFHAGIDFSTRREINLPVYAVEEGYVSRIRASSVGYGKCVYITHPDGKVSVYAHLNSFSLKISKVIMFEQYKRRTFEIDMQPRPRTLYVRKNEIIGLSGNTGGSSGPHLHFEIRDEKTEVPINPLTSYKLNDPSPPELQQIAFFNLADTCSPVFMRSIKVREGTKDTLLTENQFITLDKAIIGIAFSGFDRARHSGNPNNIYAAELFMDGRLIYSHRLNNISFTYGRYVNEFSHAVGRTKFQKCFLPSIYPQDMYGNHYNKGRIILSDTLFHKFVLKVRDEYGNSRSVKFFVRTKKFNYYSSPSVKSDLFVECHKDFLVKKNGLYLFIPERTLYYSTPLIIENSIEINDRFTILPSNVNLNAGASVGFKVPQKYLKSRGKLILRGRSSVSTPINSKDSIYFTIRNFESYHLMLDTVPPRVQTLLSDKRLKQAWQMDNFSLVITDNLSGIGRYDLWLNGTWVLAEYDAKKDLLTYYFDEDTPIGILQFKLELEDKVGNKTVFNYTLRK